MTINRTEHWSCHVSPAWEECGEAARLPASDKQVNVLWCRDDWYPSTRFPAVPLWQVSVIDFSVAIVKADVVVRVGRLGPQIAADVAPAPVLFGDCGGVFRADDYGA